MSPAADNVIQRLDAARQKWWLFSLLTTTLLALCASFGTFLIFMLADSYLKFSQTTLTILFLTWAAVSLALLAGVGRRLLRGQRSIEAAARRIETEFPELGSDLINLVQLSEQNGNESLAFCEAAVRQAAERLGHVALDRAAYCESRWRRFVHCMQTPRDLIESLAALAILLAVAAVCDSYIPNWSSAASRLLAPWRFVPSVGSVEIVSVAPGNANVLIGDSLEITAEIKNPDAVPHRAVLLTTPQGEAESSLAMAADENYRHYKITIPSILKPAAYRLEIGDSQTQTYSIGVREKPVVEGIEVAFRYPAYLNRKNETPVQKENNFDLEAPQYTVAALRLRTSVPVARASIESDADRYIGRIEDDGRLVSVEMPLLKNGSYVVRLTDDAGHGDQNPRVNRITVLPDKPPSVEILKPSAEQKATASPDGSLPVTIRAGDDHGVGRIRLEMKCRQPNSETDPPVEIVKQWTDFPGGTMTTAVCRHALELKSDRFKPGQTLFVRAVASDRRRIDAWGLDLRPQETAGAWHEVKIVAEDVKIAAVLAELENLRGAIWKIFEKQVRTRASAAEILKKEQPAERGIAASEVCARQIEIQKSSSELAASIGDSERRERTAVKRVLNSLSLGPMLQAVSHCDDLLKLKTAAEFDKPAGELTAAQAQIIDVLRKLLDVTRQAQAEVMAEMKKRPGGDLPNDVKQKLQDMHGKLDEFLKQQKKIIEASENLAKKPVEDFTEAEKELLKGLAAAEDDLAKFMKDLHSDMSKLPEQDFSSASMAKELAEIQTELKMAADALTKKSVDIAVPIEQLGYEMAEEMKTNLEKWLPDSPDREKWSQEESPTDKDKEAPMAELPGELEDIMGDLMEQEEDLFDEMEDISSSAVDSLDKGAGWDALDGPISNMSAKGVTGNRLPNTSEIGGRSGEGRQGKSSGEFVGDEAVSKGGRKTPSRLTADPFMKGQIKDHSKQSAGGATGGGKESGKGGEGLEGPAARAKAQRDAARLAGKQATLRNKAEAIDLQFQVTQYHRTDLKKMIEIMSQVERDLRAGRYQNAMRQRQSLLGGLRDVKKFVDGDVEVRQDASANLPANIQKEILGGMQDQSPAGWDQLNRQYFERLSNGQKEK